MLATTCVVRLTSQLADSNKYWVALLRAPGVGPILARRLLDYFGDAEAVFSGQRQQWQALGCKGPALDWLAAPDWALCAADLAWLAADNQQLIHCFSPQWPSQLSETDGAPIALYAMGDVDLLSMPQLAIVGSRTPTASGRDAAHEFGRHLASKGVVVTSGLALGVDAAAHEGALQADGLTIAVCGTGLDRVYPRANHGLAQQIAERGLLLSEFPIGTAVAAHNFPKRNRIISALSLGTLVVEAALRSGSLITARYASEQGREVFAMPGSIHNPLARGCHQLIRDGAKLVENAAHVFEELAPQLGQAGRDLAGETAVADNDRSAEKAPEGAESPLLKVMEYDPISVDQLVQKSGLTASEVSSMLVMLELEGRVAKTPTGEFIRR